MDIDEIADFDANQRACCPDCHGEGGFHDCGEDTCCCADTEGGPDDYDWYDCPACHGKGWI